MIKAEIVADSVNTIGERITTMLVTFPRIILAELNTHRAFSRNSASSRAIPFEKMVKAVEENPFIPIAWQKDHKGMQGFEYFTKKVNVETTDLGDLKLAWLEARDYAIKQSTWLNKVGVTKQLCNRLLEPFMWHTVLITATDFSNFFELRCPKYERPYIYGNRGDVKEAVFLVCSQKDWYEIAGADKNGIKLETGKSISKTYLEFQAINKGQSEIHMMALAEAMWDTYNESKPRLLQDGEWHIPFESDLDDTLVDDIMIEKSNGKDRYREFLLTKIKIATARCARTSYTVVGEEGKEYSYEADIKLHDKLLADKHQSPLEHLAQAMPGIISRNFKGFKQYREIVENKD